MADRRRENPFWLWVLAGCGLVAVVGWFVVLRHFFGVDPPNPVDIYNVGSAKGWGHDDLTKYLRQKQVGVNRLASRKTENSAYLFRQEEYKGVQEKDLKAIAEYFDKPGATKTLAEYHFVYVEKCTNETIASVKGKDPAFSWLLFAFDGDPQLLQEIRQALDQLGN